MGIYDYKEKMLIEIFPITYTIKKKVNLKWKPKIFIKSTSFCFNYLEINNADANSIKRNNWMGFLFLILQSI